MWDDTLPVCENTGRLSPRLIYLSALLVQQPVGWQNLLGFYCTQDTAVSDWEG